MALEEGQFLPNAPEKKRGKYGPMDKAFWLGGVLYCLQNDKTNQVYELTEQNKFALLFANWQKGASEER